MPEVTTGAVIGVTIEGRLWNQQILLTHHYKLNALSSIPFIQADELFDAMQVQSDTFEGLNNTYAACTSASLTGIATWYQVIRPSRFVKQRRDTTFPEGGVAEDSLPPNVAHAITVRTDAAGPKQRGTKHIGAVPPSFTEAGQPTPSAVTALENLGAALARTYQVTIQGEQWQLIPIIYWRTDPTNSPTVTNYILGSTTRVERRRTVGLGS